MRTHSFSSTYLLSTDEGKGPPPSQFFRAFSTRTPPFLVYE